MAAERQVWELQEELTKAKVVDEQLSSAAGRVEHLDEQLAHTQDQLRRCQADADAAQAQAKQHAAWLQSQVRACPVVFGEPAWLEASQCRVRILLMAHPPPP